ncbi:hypothetical protein [Burkholderia sp. BE17]|uniref:hypothetical protein n=1 Tax=Burkholderia sp. BE17 TaxID=2656644 RepID=UPI001D11A0FC|nr:hypothetical protein [Burkholderia sp. BE17]
MSLVTSPFSAVVTGSAVELMCCPGTTVHAESIVTVAKESAVHTRRMAVRWWSGITPSNGRSLFIFLSSIVEPGNSGRSLRCRDIGLRAGWLRSDGCPAQSSPQGFCCHSFDTLSGSNSGRLPRARFALHIVVTLLDGIQTHGNRSVLHGEAVSGIDCQKLAMTE